MIYTTAKNNSIMQVDLNKLEIWTKKRQMEFNVSKCSYLQIGKKSKDYDHGYLLRYQVLKTSTIKPISKSVCSLI